MHFLITAHTCGEIHYMLKSIFNRTAEEIVLISLIYNVLLQMIQPQSLSALGSQTSCTSAPRLESKKIALGKGTHREHM